MKAKRFPRFAPLFRSKHGISTCCGREESFSMRQLPLVRAILAEEYKGKTIIIYGLMRGESFDDPISRPGVGTEKERYIEEYTVPGKETW